MNYDIIGDVHGHADKLEGLLQKLDYKVEGGSYRHPERKAVFLGDLIDRGTQNRRVIKIVRNMVDSGNAHAIMGNHEYNAICYHTQNSQQEYLRPHTDIKTGQHQRFLNEFPLGHPETNDVIEWFKSLPLFHETDHFRVIHACWDSDKIAKARRYLNHDNTLMAEHLEDSADKNMEIFNIIETLLKGVEIILPESRSFLDKDNNKRQHIRVKWWGEVEGKSYRDLAVGYEERDLENIPTDYYPDIQKIPVYKGVRPVFFGHYWMTGNPVIQHTNACCLDYSVGKGGDLVCYTLSCHSHSDLSCLDIKNFVIGQTIQQINYLVAFIS